MVTVAELLKVMENRADYRYAEDCQELLRVRGSCRE